MKNIIVLFPTKGEAKYFKPKREGVAVHFMGVGLVASAYSTLKIISECKPDIIILAGVAGVYPTAPYSVGDCVLVAEEHEADLGFFHAEGFRHIDKNPITASFKLTDATKCPYVNNTFPFPLVVSNSANSSMPPHVDSTGVDIENMEGSAFFSVCTLEGVEFYELRAISNTVDINRKDWNLELATQELAKGLDKLLDYI